MDHLPSANNKKDVLKIAMEEFKKSKQSKVDYMNLFIAVHKVLRQGSGLVWSEVGEVIESVIERKDDIIMPALYREDFEDLQLKGCSIPGCDCQDEGLLFMHSECHPQSPTQTYFDDGMLTVICAECREVIITTAVQERYPQ